jgi:hypothetical protein
MTFRFTFLALGLAEGAALSPSAALAAKDDVTVAVVCGSAWRASGSLSAAWGSTVFLPSAGSAAWGSSAAWGNSFPSGSSEALRMSAAWGSAVPAMGEL